MRKKLSLLAASVAVACGVGFGMASPAGAANLGYYQSQADCNAAKAATGRADLFCDWSPGDDGKGIWLLTDRAGGG